MDKNLNKSYDFSEFSCDNVTLRTKTKSASLLDTSPNKSTVNNSSNSNYLDLSSQSLPNISTLDESLLFDYKTQIERLEIELSSAHVEIEKVNYENTELKKQLENQEKIIKLFKINWFYRHKFK